MYREDMGLPTGDHGGLMSVLDKVKEMQGEGGTTNVQINIGDQKSKELVDKLEALTYEELKIFIDAKMKAEDEKQVKEIGEGQVVENKEN
jgi:hypothetical protein